MYWLIHEKGHAAFARVEDYDASTAKEALKVWRERTTDPLLLDYDASVTLVATKVTA